MESVQRHSSGRGNNDDGQMDFSLTAIDLPTLRLHLSDVIASNKDRWKELSMHGNVNTHTHTHSGFKTLENIALIWASSLMSESQ